MWHELKNFEFTITQHNVLKGPESMTNWKACTAVERDPHKISGAWAFSGPEYRCMRFLRTWKVELLSVNSWSGTLRLRSGRWSLFSSTKPNSSKQQ